MSFGPQASLASPVPERTEGVIDCEAFPGARNDAIRPTYPVPRREALPCMIPSVPFPLSDRACSVCAASFPEPFLGFVSLDPPRLCRDFSPGMPALAFGSRLLLPTDAIPLPPIDQLFAGPPDTRWLAPAEPTEWLGDAGLRFVGLDATLAASVRVLVEREGGLQDSKENPCQPPNQCQIIAAHAIATRDPLAPPEDLEDPGVVLSARHEALWVIGGTLRGATYEGIHRYDVGSERWSRVGTYTAAGDGLGRVLAATYAPAGDRLYVLDEIRADASITEGRGGGRARAGREPARTLRLLAIDPSLGQPRVLASWERRTDHDVFGLTSDGAGRLYAAASRQHAGVHAVVRLATDEAGVWRAEAFAFGVGGYLQAGVHANQRGVSLAVMGPAGPRVIGYEAGELEPLPGGAERCF